MNVVIPKHTETKTATSNVFKHSKFESSRCFGPLTCSMLLICHGYTTLRTRISFTIIHRRRICLTLLNTKKDECGACGLGAHTKYKSIACIRIIVNVLYCSKYKCISYGKLCSNALQYANRGGPLINNLTHGTWIFSSIRA